MQCCTPYILPFQAEAITVIPYTDSLRADFGDYPTVDVYYADTPAGPYVKAETGVNVNRPLTRIEVHHGGPSSGYIRISS